MSSPRARPHDREPERVDPDRQRARGTTPAQTPSATASNASMTDRVEDTDDREQRRPSPRDLDDPLAGHTPAPISRARRARAVATAERSPAATARRRAASRSYENSPTARRRAASPMRRRSGAVAERAARSRVRTAATSLGVDDEPGLAVDDRLVRPAAAPRDRGHAARRGLEEHDAEALGLEPAPPLAAAHREHVGATRRAPARSSSGTRPRKSHPSDRGTRARAARGRGPRRRSRAARPVERRDRVDQDVEALARARAGDTPSTSGRSGSRPKRLRVSFAASRRRPAGSARRRHPAGSRRPRSGAARGPLAPRAPGTTRPRRPRRRRAGPGASAPAASRAAVRAGDLGAVRDHDVRRGGEPRRRASPSGSIGSTKMTSARDLARERVDALARASGSAAAPADATRSTRNGCCAIPRAGAGVRRREHRRLVRREPTPQLVEVRLDAADLGREVVGDEQRRHGQTLSGYDRGECDQRPTALVARSLPNDTTAALATIAAMGPCRPARGQMRPPRSCRGAPPKEGLRQVGTRIATANASLLWGAGRGIDGRTSGEARRRGAIR